MSAKPEAKLRLPPGLSPAEEAQWWDEHLDDLDWEHGEIEVVPPAHVRRSTPVHLRLPVDLLEAIKQEAAKRHTSHQWLIRTWLEERLQAEAAAPSAAAPAPPRRTRTSRRPR